MRELVIRSPVALAADPSRVLARLFVPGHELLLDTVATTSDVLARILAMPEDVVCSTLRHVQARYDGRHRDLPGVLIANYERIAHRISDDANLTDQRRSLLGACFTDEYSVEGAALFNPSAVSHPDQSNLAAGQIRFILSLRAVGEGHRSCVEFRTGVLGPGNELRIDDPGPHVETGWIGPAPYDRAVFNATLIEEGADGESASFLIDCLPSRFNKKELERALATLASQRVTRQGAAFTDELARRIARNNYEVEFSPESSIAERVLWPHTPSESHGIEDVRFVRFVEASL